MLMIASARSVTAAQSDLTGLQSPCAGSAELLHVQDASVLQVDQQCAGMRDRGVACRVRSSAVAGVVRPLDSPTGFTAPSSPSRLAIPLSVAFARTLQLLFAMAILAGNPDPSTALHLARPPSSSRHFGRPEHRGSDATKPVPDDHPLRMSSTTRTMIKIRTIAPPPIYMKPPSMIRPGLLTRADVYPPVRSKVDHASRDAAPTRAARLLKW